MSRTTAALDKVVTLIIGLALLALAVLAYGWWSEWLFSADSSVDLSGASGTSDQSWFPWAIGAAGVVLVIVALRWLLAHAYRRVDSTLVLKTDKERTKLRAELSAVTSAAEQSLESIIDVRSARGSVTREHGKRVLSFSVTVDPHADLDRLGQECARVLDDVKACTDNAVNSRVIVDNVSRSSNVARVN